MSRFFSRWRYSLLAVVMAAVCVLVPLRVTAAPPVSVLAQAQTPTQLEQQGRTAYAQGDYGAAAAAFEAAATGYAAAGDGLRQALMLGNLSLAHQQQGEWTLAERAIAQALNLSLQLDADTPEYGAARGQLWEIQAQLNFNRGQLITAADDYELAARAYRQAGNADKAASSQIAQAQALQAAGFPERSQRLLAALLSTLGRESTALRATALRVYGDLLAQRGEENYGAARLNLEASLAIAQALNLPDAISAAYRSLGNLSAAENNPEAALAAYQQAGDAASSASVLPILVSQIPLWTAQQQWRSLAETLPEVFTQAQALPLAGNNVHLRLTLASHLLALRPVVDLELDRQEQLWNEEQQALAEAKLAEERAAQLAAAQTATGEQPDAMPVAESDLELETELEDLEDIELPPFLLDPDSDLAQLLEVLPKGEEIAAFLLETEAQAQQLGDKKAEAYALGYLGQLYGQSEQWAIAQDRTERAIRLAQQYSITEVEYEFQEQSCLAAQQVGDRDLALAACRSAVKTTQQLRRDLASQGSNAEYDFQKRVDPIYRNYVNLLLQEEPSADNLKAAREAIESLQLAELDNFFREACLSAQSVDIDSIDSTAAVVYPILLSDRVVTIVSLPGGEFRYYSTPANAETVDLALIELQGQLVRERGISSPTPASIRNSAKQVYDWVLAEADAELQASGVETLVFVLDGRLRNLPMAVLYDGEKYLIEKYAIALTPGLQLLDSRPFDPENRRVLLAGIAAEQTVAETPWNPLPNVVVELEEVQSRLQGTVLFDSEVTNLTLAQQIATSSAPIVHIATHGEFGQDPESTFLVTWQDTLNVNQLSQILRTSELSRDREIELLVLSACETAEGDDRAILGLAGMATRSGARSTLASLWKVSDLSTAELMGEFYSGLTETNLSKAKALQQAQISLLKTEEYRNPYFWSAFILVGNWL